MDLQQLKIQWERQGRQEGRQEGETDFGKLVKLLVKDRRMEDLDRATEDSLYRQELYEEYGI